MPEAASTAPNIVNFSGRRRQRPRRHGQVLQGDATDMPTAALSLLESRECQQAFNWVRGVADIFKTASELIGRP